MKELFTNIINKIQQIAEKLGLIADYVVEQGTSGIWTYRKWNSGIAECWGHCTGSYSITTQTGSLFYCSDTVALPSGLFSELTAININARSNYGVVASVNNDTSLSRIGFYLQCATSASTYCYVFFSIKGRWK